MELGKCLQLHDKSFEKIFTTPMVAEIASRLDRIAGRRCAADDHLPKEA
jgi:hypothetical protein